MLKRDPADPSFGNQSFFLRSYALGSPKRADGGVMSRKRIILWAVALLVAYGVGFAIGVALWEEDIAPPGRNQPGPRLTRRA